MVKGEIITESELLKEDERLEKIFREKIRKQKNLKINEKQFQSRVLDILDSIFKSGIANKNNMSLILKRAPSILNKLCLSVKFEHINGQKIMQTLVNLVSVNLEEMSKFPEAVENLIKTIFHIFVYKKPNKHAEDLLKIILILLKSQNIKIEKIVEQNLAILISFLEKGKEVEKVFFSFRKILGHSYFCLMSRFEELLGILERTKNTFLVEQFVKFLFETFHSKLLVSNGANTENRPKISLKNFSSIFEMHVLQIYGGIVEREKGLGKEAEKKSLKSRQYLIKLIEYLKANCADEQGDLDKTLGLLKADLKGSS